MSSCCPLRAGFSRRKEEAGHSVRPRRRALSGCPPLLLLSHSLRPCRSHVLPAAFLLSVFTPFVLLWVCSPHVVLLFWGFPSHPFVLCCPPHVVLWSFCCPAAVVLFTLLSEAGAGAAAAHHNNSSCRLSCLGCMLVSLERYFSRCLSRK